MIDTAQTIANQAIQKVTQSWMSRFFRMSDTESKEYANQLDAFFRAIADAHFGPFADLVARQPEFAYSEEARQRAKQIAIDNTINILKKDIVSYIATEPLQNAEEAIIGYFLMHIQHHPKFSKFPKLLQLLKNTFPQNKEGVATLAGVVNAGHLVPPPPAKVRFLVGCIAYTLQNIAIAAPSRYYSTTVVDTDARKSLETVLKAVDVVRTEFASQPIPSIFPRGSDHALREFNRQIAFAEQHVWLPFKPLVTAPLASSEDLELYARASKDVEIFANRISTSDGVFLVTGYRGVGKSTFIYQALSLLAKKQSHKTDDTYWHVVPISLSLAKASGIPNILRLCIRRLFDTFLKETDERSDVMSSLTKGVDKLLTQKEQDHLRLAHLRATWKVNLQRDDNMKAFKQLWVDAGMSIKLSDFFAPTVGNVVAGTFPSFGINGKMSKEWSKAMGSTVALPDYDEDKAEDDIVQFIRMLATPDKKRGNSCIRLVFIFDEMDKMSEEEQEELIKQLKNLFLERHSVFLLVTSKGFYYRWWDKRNVEDDVLSSYFSWIQTIPFFTSTETALLLKRLIQVDDELSKEEEEFINTLARYLTYRARGIPRDIMRELRAVQIGLDVSPQAHIDNRMGQYPTIYIYAELQNSLERLFDDTNTTISTQTSSASTSATVDNTLVTEHMWMNEERKEQVKRGLYVIMEELLDQGSMELNPDSDVFKRIYEDNFKMVASHNFKRLLEPLALRLRDIRLNPDTPFPSHDPEDTSSTELKLFSLKPATETQGETTVAGFPKIEVEQRFYRITGRSPNVASVAVPFKDTPSSQEKIEASLKSTDDWQQQLAIGELQHASHPFSEGVYDQLCHLFLSAPKTQTRRSVIGLQDSAFFEAARRLDVNLLYGFIDNETDERLLQEFIRLVRICTDVGKQENFTPGTIILLRVLARHTRVLSRQQIQRQSVGSALGYTSPISGNTSLALPESLLSDTISILATIASEDILLQVMQSLNPDKDIPNELLVPLRTLESKSKQGLIELLVSLDFNAITPDTVQTLLRGEDDNRLAYLWEWVLAQKEKAVAKTVLIVLAQQIMKNPAVDATTKVVVWVNDSPTWDDIDRSIINVAMANSPDLFKLQTLTNDDKKYRLPGYVSPTKQVTPPSNTSSLPASASPKGVPASPTYRANWLLVMLSALVMLAIYCIAPFDVPKDYTIMTLVSLPHITSRLLEGLYIYSAILAIICVIITIIESDKVPTLGGAFFFVILTALCFYLQIHFFPFAPSFWGQVALIVLLALIIIVPIVIYNTTRKKVVSTSLPSSVV